MTTGFFEILTILSAYALHLYQNTYWDIIKQCDISLIFAVLPRSCYLCIIQGTSPAKNDA